MARGERRRARPGGRLVGQPFRSLLKVRHYEADGYGHVNHANHVHYLETGRIEALESVGLPLREMRRQGFLIVAADLTVRYHSPASPGEMLEIATHIEEIRGARTVWVQEVREAVTRRLVVTARVTGAFTSEDGRPVRTPEAFRPALAALLQPAGEPGGAAPAPGRSAEHR
jgi:YbgC/YbaW family acyl-CoA thioester hydrolase